MRACCPGRCGCNDPDGGGPCALEILRAVEGEPEAALALERWNTFQDALRQDRGHGELRFRRRVYSRARDRALIVLAMRGLLVGREAEAFAAAPYRDLPRRRGHPGRRSDLFEGRQSIAPPAQSAQPADADRRRGIAA